MKRSLSVITVLAVVVCALAAMVANATASRTAPATSSAAVAGTVQTKLVLQRFTASGKTVVGHGTLQSTYRNAAGATLATSSKPVNMKLAAAQAGPCQILYLQLDELDLTLLGLRVYLRSATDGQPIQLTLSADSTHGILGKLFCDLAQTTIGSGGPKGATATSAPLATTKLTAKAAATQLSKRMHNSTVLNAEATVYEPANAPTRHTQSTRTTSAAAANCPVLHVILGPLHLDLLGLIVDLNKIALDIEAIPHTTIGDLFCSLSGGTTTTPTTTTP